MEKRALIAVVLSLLILIVYQEWIARQYGAPPPPAQVEKETLRDKVEKIVEPSPKPQPAPQRAKPAAQPRAEKARELRVETDHYVALFTSQGARLKSFTLKHYRAAVDEKSPPFEMISSTPGVPYPLGIQLPGSPPVTDETVVYSVRGGNLKLTGESKESLVFEGQSPSGVRLLKQFTFTGSGYTIQLQLAAQGANGSLSPTLLLTTDESHKGLTQDAVFEGLLAVVDSKIKREQSDEIKKGTEISGTVSWAGFGYTYFLFALLPEMEGQQRLAAKEAAPALVMELSTPAQSGAADGSRYTLFIGPKELNTLKTMEKGLERSIDFGYFGFVAVPFLYVLHFSHRFTGSYGIDIILLTILLKLLMAPLTHKSFVSMKQMQKLQPQMERIKEKFKDDKEKMNKEIMELYRRNKVNPLGGCLPMLLQFPVFIGLYNALLTPIELRHAPFLWIKDLSRPDWESLPLELAGWHLGIPVLTLFMGASMLIQQWMTPSAGDPNQKRMMMFMPLIFTVMFINFPSGLTIYWLVNNILSIAQQYLINRMDR
ncbi:MAG: hypothetical protein A3C54_06145 [Deltaproteobacteria bacterium RIFCSPHIGHO2_02_FULL_60_17]|nr:MAG: hypothetical protein A3C54_06145 [Deltaproteobacteria bacterium RIFCSPHIGHO2_02_FULL_60_17]